MNDSGWMLAFAAIVPLIVLMLTSFVKVSIVIAMLRNALGATDAPSGLVVMGISLVLTFFVMAPIAVDVVNAASADRATPGGTTPTGPTPTPDTTPTPTGTTPRTPPAAGTPTSPTTGGPTGTTPGTTPTSPATGGPSGTTPTAPGTTPTPPTAGAPTPTVDPAGSGAPMRVIDVEDAVRKLAGPARQGDIDRAVRGLEPIRGFLEKHSSTQDRDTFQATSKKLGRATTGNEIWVLAPAFLATELREAFAIAVLIFIPFLVIDLIVGLALAALGLTNTSPQSIALPIKLLLFVAVDGWRLLLDSLLRGYA